MTDYQDRLGGGVTSTGTQYLLAVGTSVTAAPSNGFRLSVRLHNLGAAPIFTQYGAVATSTTGLPVIPSAAILEQDYLGAVNVACASGATSILAVREVSLP